MQDVKETMQSSMMGRIVSSVIGSDVAKCVCKGKVPGDQPCNQVRKAILEAKGGKLCMDRLISCDGFPVMDSPKY